MADLPPDTKEAIRLYVADRIEPGSFLTRVLCNDLKGACARADGVHRHLLFTIVDYLYNHCPSQCWGSEARYTAWLDGPTETAP